MSKRELEDFEVPDFKRVQQPTCLVNTLNVADHDLYLEHKVKYWKNSGSMMCGASANAILYNLGIINYGDISAPYDSYDFMRCINTVRYFGLESRIYEMRNVSKRWYNIIEHWDYLVDIYDRSPYSEQKITNVLLLDLLDSLYKINY